MQFSERITSLAAAAERDLAPIFARIDEVSFENTNKVMDAFREHRVAATNFDTTSGYGYDDRGRDVLDRIWADVMGAEAAFVRHSIVNGTQALTIGLFGLLRPNDTLLAVTGKPYDTLDEVIGKYSRGWKADRLSLANIVIHLMQKIVYLSPQSFVKSLAKNST